MGLIKACLNGARAASEHRALPLTPRQLAADGAAAVAAVGIEAGLWQIEDVATLQASGFADALTRVLVEPGEEDPAAALATAHALDDALDSAGIAAPRVHHGFAIATWDALRRAKALGHGWRIGLEDTLVLPDGRPAQSNAELVSAALAL